MVSNRRERELIRRDVEQTAWITKMLKDQGGADPSSLEISATRLSVSGYGKTLGKPDSKMSEAPHG